MKGKTATLLLRECGRERMAAIVTSLLVYTGKLSPAKLKPLILPEFRLRTATGAEIPLSHASMVALRAVENGFLDFQSSKAASPGTAERNVADAIEQELVPNGLVVVKKKGNRMVYEVSDMTKAGEFEASK
jgi:hypothetical protein